MSEKNEYKGRMIKYLKASDLADDLFEVIFEKHEGFMAGDIVFGYELGDAAYCLKVGVVKPSKAKERRVASLVSEGEIENRIAAAIKEIEEGKNAQIQDLEKAAADLRSGIREAIGLEEDPEDLLAEVKDFVQGAGEVEEDLRKEVKDLQAALDASAVKVKDLEKEIEGLKKKAKPDTANPEVAAG